MLTVGTERAMNEVACDGIALEALPVDDPRYEGKLREGSVREEPRVYRELRTYAHRDELAKAA